MKFADVKIGQLFEFQGNTYIKDSPILACLQGSEQKRMFRLSQEVTSNAPVAATTPDPGIPLSRQRVQQSAQQLLELLQADLVQLEPALDTAQIAALQQRFTAQLTWFCAQLDLQPLETASS